MPTGSDLPMQRLSEPQGSPSGDRIAFVVRTTDFAANRGRTDIWTVSVGGGDAAPLTTHEAGDNNPRWAPDGKSLYFLSTRSGSNQVWRVPVPGFSTFQARPEAEWFAAPVGGVATSSGVGGTSSLA